jgi:arylsulfatase A
LYIKYLIINMGLFDTVLLTLLTISGFTCNSSNKITSKKNTLRTNIILIVADDLGVNDVACYNNKFIETPNIDALAKEGVLFTKAYAAAPLCSPTRASIITGCNPTRINLTEHLHGYAAAGPKQKLITPKIEGGLPEQLTTIPEALKTNGYISAHFGKWHLGMGPSSPKAQGFDFVYGGGAEGLPKSFFYPFFNGTPYPGLLADTKEGDYLDDALTNRAIKFLDNNKGNSFFVELNFYAPHVPIEGKPSLVEKYKNKRAKNNFKGLPEDEYAAMVDNIDMNIGKLMAHLKASGLDKNTIVIFTSDNGGLHVEEVPAFAKHTPPTSNAPLRGGKGYIYEGGIREPLIIWNPTTIKNKIEKTLATTDDFFNTIMQLTGTKNTSPDGVSLVPLLENKTIADRNLYWHFPHYSPQHGLPGAVIRKGNYKLIEWYEDGKLELFNLSKDEGEQNNIAAANTARVKDMKAALDEWRKNMNAKMPVANPNYKPD